MGIRLNVTAGGGKGLFIEGFDKNGVHYLFLIFGIRFAQGRMVVTRAEVFNVYGFQYQKIHGIIRHFNVGFVLNVLDFFVLSRFPKLIPHSHDKS